MWCSLSIAGNFHDPSCSAAPPSFVVRLECILVILRTERQAFCEYNCIFNRLISSLTYVWQCRVTGSRLRLSLVIPYNNNSATASVSRQSKMLCWATGGNGRGNLKCRHASQCRTLRGKSYVFIWYHLLVLGGLRKPGAHTFSTKGNRAEHYRLPPSSRERRKFPLRGRLLKLLVYRLRLITRFQDGDLHLIWVFFSDSYASLAAGLAYSGCTLGDITVVAVDSIGTNFVFPSVCCCCSQTVDIFSNLICAHGQFLVLALHPLHIRSSH